MKSLRVLLITSELLIPGMTFSIALCCLLLSHAAGGERLTSGVASVHPVSHVSAQESSDSADADATAEANFESAINLILDCSGSMGLKDVEMESGDPRSRGEVCVTAVKSAVEKLSGSKTGLGLMLFGHRSYWTKTADGKYEVRLSELGREQGLSIEDTDPSFDVNQEVPVALASEKQIAAIGKLLSAVEFHRGAQSPSFQAIDQAVQELVNLPDKVQSRSVIVVMDGFNQVADSTAAAKDVRLEALAEKLQSQNNADKALAVSVHFVLFGKVFEMNDDGEFPSEAIATRVKDLTTFAENSGGSVQVASGPSELGEVLTSLTEASDSRKTGKLAGEIHKNSSRVGSSSEFKVTLLEGDKVVGGPVSAKEGKFTFERVPTGKKYTLKVTGRIRNTIYEAEQKDVEVPAKANADPVKVSLD